MQRLRIILAGMWLASPAFAFSQMSAPPQQEGLNLLEAVRAAIADNPQLKSQHVQVDIARGVARQAAGLFDFHLASGLQQQRQITELTQAEKLSDATTAGALIAQVSTYTFQGQQTFRNGLTLIPTFGLTRTVDNLLNPGGLNNATGELEIIIPLLQGRGKGATDAQETADRKEVEATIEDDRQLVAQIVAKTAADYWSLVASVKVLAIDQESEQRGLDYLDNVHQLVQSDVAPQNDLHAVTANVALRRATREAAELQLVSARQQLFLDMGTDAVGMVAVRNPGQDFPGGNPGAALRDDAATLAVYLQSAKKNRADYRADVLRIEENDILLVGARNQLLPQLNVAAAAGYIGQEEGRQFTAVFAPAYSGTRAPIATLAINYTFPVGNNAAKGQLAQLTGAGKQARLGATNLEHTLMADIVNATASVNKSIFESQHAQQAVESYQSALDGERDKYRFGTGSIVSILTEEDSLTNAMLTLVQAQTSYAQSITQFRYATGTLIEPDTASPTLAETDFFSLPQLASLTGGSQQPK